MTSKCLLNLDMSAALRLLSVCCSHPLFSHHTGTATADLLRPRRRALFLRTLKADSSHPSHPSCLSISLTIQSTTSYDIANTSPDMTVCRRRPHPGDPYLFSPQMLRLRQARHAFPTSPSPSRREDSTSRGAQEHSSTSEHQPTSKRVHEYTSTRVHEYTSERKYSQRSTYASEQARGRIDGGARRWAHQHIGAPAHEHEKKR